MHSSQNRSASAAKGSDYPLALLQVVLGSSLVTPHSSDFLDLFYTLIFSLNTIAPRLGHLPRRRYVRQGALLKSCIVEDSRFLLWPCQWAGCGVALDSLGPHRDYQDYCKSLGSLQGSPTVIFRYAPLTLPRLLAA